MPGTIQASLYRVNKNSCEQQIQGILYNYAMKTTGERVAERLAALKAAGISLQQVANRAHPRISYQVIQQIRDGETKASGLIVPLARALGCTAEWLYDGGGSDLPLEPDILAITDRLKIMSVEKRRKVAELLEFIDSRPTDLAAERKRRRRIS